MTTIERMLTEFTPLPLDIIRYCIQPYMIRHRQWENTFAHVIESINFFGDRDDHDVRLRQLERRM